MLFYLFLNEVKTLQGGILRKFWYPRTSVCIKLAKIFSLYFFHLMHPWQAQVFGAFLLGLGGCGGCGACGGWSWSCVQMFLMCHSLSVNQSGHGEAGHCPSLLALSLWFTVISEELSVLPLWLVLTGSCLIVQNNILTPKHVRRWIQTSQDVLRPVVEVQLTLLLLTLPLL